MLQIRKRPTFVLPSNWALPGQLEFIAGSVLLPPHLQTNAILHINYRDGKLRINYG